jgi:hypothetical protein
MSQNLRPETLTSLKQIGLSDELISAFSTIKSVSLPNTTSISKLGFSKELVAKLPADAQHLTKADLMSLGGWGTTRLTPAAAKLTTADISSIKSVLGGAMAGGAIGKIAMDINCCCCPCCCAATVTAKKGITKAKAFVC